MSDKDDTRTEGERDATAAASLRETKQMPAAANDVSALTV